MEQLNTLCFCGPVACWVTYMYIIENDQFAQQKLVMLVKTLIYLASYVCTVSAFGLGYSLK